MASLLDEGGVDPRGVMLAMLGAGLLSTPNWKRGLATGALGGMHNMLAAQELNQHNAVRQQQIRKQALAEEQAAEIRKQVARMMGMLGGPPPVDPGMPGAVTPEAGLAPTTAAQFGPPQENIGFSGLPPAPRMVPQGTPPQNVTGFQPPDALRLMPPQLKFAVSLAALKDPTEFAKYIDTWSQVKLQHGVGMDAAGNLLFKMTDDGIQYFRPGDGVGEFIPYSSGVAQAAANRAGLITQAQERAKSGFATVTGVPGPGGRTQSGWTEDVFGPPPGARGGAGAPPSGLGPGVRLNLEGPMSPRDFARATTMAAGEGGAPAAAGGMVIGEDPMIRRRAEQELETAEGRKRAGYQSMLRSSEEQYNEIRKNFVAARTMVNHVANLEKADKGEIFSGPGGLLMAGAANWFNSLIPGAGISSERLANTQFAEAEISRMQQALGKAFPGQQSNYELQVVTNSLPQLIKTAEGRAKIYAAMRQAAAWSEANYKSASQHMKANDGSLIGWLPDLPPPIESLRRPPAPASKGRSYGGYTIEQLRQDPRYPGRHSSGTP